MKFISRFFYVPVAGLLVLSSCAKEGTESFDKIENQALEAWMTQHRSTLVENQQTDGKYYIDVLEAGAADAKPLNDEELWVRFDFTGRDLSGNIILTRSASDAYLAGTFSKYTRYVPFYRYCGKENSGLMEEGTWLAMRKALTLGDEYYEANKVRLGLTSPEVKLRYGSEIQLYMPSTVVGSNGVEGSGGYEGQYVLNAQRPFIVTMMITDTVKNPLEREGTNVDDFCKENGGLLIYSKEADLKTGAVTRPKPNDVDNPNHAYNPACPRWVSACDTIPQIYVDVRYNPTKTGGDPLTYPAPYHVGFAPYVNKGSVTTIDQQIAEALKKRFYSKDKEYVGVQNLDADSVTLTGSSNIWYIGRFLDGFIFDTNIDEVKKIIYGEVKQKGSVLSYTPEKKDMIQAFYYVVPNLKYGQWAELITTSTNAYGSSGQGGTSNSSSSSGYSSSYYDYINYLNYANSYYGSGGYYGGYYGDYYGGAGGYGGYGGGMYGDMYGSDYNSSDTGSEVKVIRTEIPSFSPLIFQIYIEPKK